MHYYREAQLGTEYMIHKYFNHARSLINFFWFKFLFIYYRFIFKNKKNLKINIGAGNQKIAGYLSCDVLKGSDLRLDLSKSKLPFDFASVEVIICTSAINYITYKESELLVKEMLRVLRPGGIARIGVQDLDLLVQYYHESNTEFFNQKNSDGSDRFPGDVIADKFNNWFTGFYSNGYSCKYVYNFESLKNIFIKNGFAQVERKNYLESCLEEIAEIDNRADQMFFLEAVK